MYRNVSLLLSYVGTHYYGFQKTKMGPSIEEALEKALQKIVSHPVDLNVASRTDRGVHARGQFVSFFLLDSISLELLSNALPALLPKDIAVLEIKEEKENFHATRSALGKHYRYQICNGNVQLPFHRKTSWHLHRPLDLSEMRKGGQWLVGTHDFSAFSNMKYENPVRTIYQIQISTLSNQRLIIDIFGDHFLYKMARNIVGTLVYVGLNKISADLIPSILRSKKRAAAGVCAPAHGLCLERVFYSELKRPFFENDVHSLMGGDLSFEKSC